MKSRTRDTLCRMVTDVRPFDPGLRVDRMDFRGPPWVLPANTGTWAANVFVGIRRAHSNSMFDGTLLCLALLSASGAIAATSNFLLGVDYSEWLGLNVTQIATDKSGALYILSTFPESRGSTPSWVTKL